MTAGMDRILSELDHRHPFIQTQSGEKLLNIDDPDRFSRLLRTLHSGTDLPERLRIIVVLAWSGRKDAVEPLIERLSDPEALVRGWAAWALGRLNVPHAFGPLVKRLQDDDPRVAEAAALALGQIGASEAVGPLIGRLADSDPRIRVAAIEALAALGNPRTVEPLIGALTDRDSQVRETAARALAQTGDARAAEALVARMADYEHHVRTAAEVALGSLGAVAVAPLTTALVAGLRIRPGQSHPWQHAGRSERMQICRAAAGVLLEAVPRLSELQGGQRGHAMEVLRGAVPAWKKAAGLLSRLPATVKSTLRRLVQVTEAALGDLHR